jgi:hypothetical protein
MQTQFTFRSSLAMNELLLSKRYKLVRHAAALSLIASFAFNFFSFYRQPYAFWVNATMFINLVSLYYFNMYWLVPSFLLKERLAAYCLIIAAYIAVVYAGISQLHMQLSAYRIMPKVASFPGHPGLFPFAFTTFVMAAASSAVKLLQRWIRDQEKMHVLQELTTKGELEALRNQISPHFLFNMLNNANMLTHKDSQKASQVLMGLSDILRYQLYDCHEKEVLLKSEIRFIEELLQLESIRRERFEFKIEVDGNVDGIRVPPMMFIIFLENAVKHSADADTASHIHVRFRARDHQLTFTCNNSRPKYQRQHNTPGGIGLTNAKRRLDLLKPGLHELRVMENEASYCCELNMQV